MVSRLSRRALLGLSTTASVVLAGCLGGSGGDETDDSSGGGETDDSTNDDDEQSGNDEDGSNATDCSVSERHEQGRADPIETTVSDNDESCGVEVARAAVRHVEEQLETEFDSSWGSSGYLSRSGEARVNLFAIQNTDGEYVTCPPVSFDEVVEVTPAEVTVRIEVEDEVNEGCTHEIYVNQIVEQEG